MPVAYLDGQITLSLDDQIALLGGILEDTAIGPYVPDSLPLRERTQFAVAGKFSKNLAESYIKLTGAYVMDGGLLPARLGIEAQPVQAADRTLAGFLERESDAFQPEQRWVEGCPEPAGPIVGHRPEAAGPDRRVACQERGHQGSLSF